MTPKQLLSAPQIELLLHRLACQLIENHRDFSATVLIGLQPRGVYVLDRLVELLQSHYGIENLNSGKLDITFSEMILDAVKNHVWPSPTKWKW